MNFDGAAGQAANVADIFQAGREDDDRERAGHLIFAEVEEVNAFRADFHSEDFSRDAFGFADVLAGFVDGDAVGGVEERDGEQEDRQREARADILAKVAGRSPGVARLDGRRRPSPHELGELHDYDSRRDSGEVWDSAEIILRRVPEWD